MQRKGINYDTGFAPFGDNLSRRDFDPAQVRREMQIIARDLHCNAVRITGRDADRIALAAGYALDEGLEAWFAPFPCNMTPDDLLPYFTAAAQAAEQLRQRAPRVVFVTGCEMTLFNSGFFPGADMAERIQNMMNPQTWATLSFAQLQADFNSFLARTVAAVRAQFGGPVTYASGSWEPVDWQPFDIASVDLYRDASNRATYRDEVRKHSVPDRPLVVSEFGCCTYRGAEDRGGIGWNIVDRTANPPGLTEPVERDEQVQVAYMNDLLTIFEEEHINGAFWFTFASYEYPYHDDPVHDLDRAAYGVVKMLDGATGTTYPGMPWEPKAAFAALAAHYAR